MKKSRFTLVVLTILVCTYLVCTCFTGCSFDFNEPLKGKVIDSYFIGAKSVAYMASIVNEKIIDHSIDSNSAIIYFENGVEYKQSLSYKNHKANAKISLKFSDLESEKVKEIMDFLFETSDENEKEYDRLSKDVYSAYLNGSDYSEKLDKISVDMSMDGDDVKIIVSYTT